MMLIIEKNSKNKTIPKVISSLLDHGLVGPIPVPVPTGAPETGSSKTSILDHVLVDPVPVPTGVPGNFETGPPVMMVMTMLGQ
jgi:hypothetical protein